MSSKPDTLRLVIDAINSSTREPVRGLLRLLCQQYDFALDFVAKDLLRTRTEVSEESGLMKNGKGKKNAKDDTPELVMNAISSSTYERVSGLSRLLCRQSDFALGFVAKELLRTGIM